MCGLVLAIFLSMRFSNTATTAIIIVAILSITSQFTREARLGKRCTLAVPFAATIGGNEALHEHTLEYIRLRQRQKTDPSCAVGGRKGSAVEHYGCRRADRLRLGFLGD